MLWFMIMDKHCIYSNIYIYNENIVRINGNGMKINFILEFGYVILVKGDLKPRALAFITSNETY